VVGIDVDVVLVVVLVDVELEVDVELLVESVDVESVVVVSATPSSLTAFLLPAWTRDERWVAPFYKTLKG